MRNSSRWKISAWAPVVLALVIPVVAVVLVVKWQQDADEARREQLIFTKLAASVNLTVSLEDQAISIGRVTTEIRRGIREARADWDRGLAKLRRAGPADDGETRLIPAAFAAHETAIEQQFSLLKAGRVRAAARFDDETTDSAVDRLQRLLAAEDRHHVEEAETARRYATLGSAITAAVAVLLIVLLFWRIQHTREALLGLRAEEEGIRRSERHFRSLAQNASDLVTVIDAEATISYQSDSAERVLGYEAADLVGRNLLELVQPDDRARILVLLQGDGPPAGASGSRFECRLRHRDESWVEVETVVASLREDPANDLRFVFTSRDITQRKALEEQLRHQAFHDQLTGLANRVLFEDRVTHALASAKRRNTTVAVLFADLDDFKLVNDSLGHSAGDDLLREIAVRLIGSLREGDTAARLGGDEFAVLLEDVTSREDAGGMAKRILAALAKPHSVSESQAIAPRASIGIAISDARSDSNGLLRDADVAMYTAKRRDKGTSFAFFETSMYSAALHRLELTDELEKAFAAEQFELHYQPIVVLETEKIVGVEALLRWNHPGRGMVAPNEFIPEAEESGLIVPLGRWVLQEACRQTGIWQRDGNESLYVCVNISTRQLADPQLASDVQAALDAGGMRPEQLVLEITESLLVEDVEHMRDRMTELKRLGVRLAIDDFGTGFSALSYLQSFPLDILKIDKSFVDGLGKGGEESTVVRAIIELGNNLDLDVIAEGVEERDQLAELRSLHSGFGQGYLFARPADAGAMTTRLRPVTGVPRTRRRRRSAAPRPATDRKKPAPR